MSQRFHFRTRRQELNSVEGGTFNAYLPIIPHFYSLALGTRANLNYLDQLAKFHKQHGHSLTRFPSVDKRPLDLYKLKKAVETRGGFERVCKGKKWAEIGRDLGYSGKIMSSLSTSLKNSYQKWLHPYEEYLRVVKPGVQQMLEFEHGGPFTPSPAPSPLKKSAHGTPIASASDSPAVRASVALNATLQNEPAQPLPSAELPRPAMSSGFTAVNSGGFTAVNAQPSPAPQTHPATPASFSAVNAPNGIHRDTVDSRTSTPLRNGGSPMLSAHNTPDLRPTATGLTPLANGQAFNQLKRTLSQDAESSINDDTDDASGRRSKRLKKGKHSDMQICAAASLHLLPQPGCDTWAQAQTRARCTSHWQTLSLTRRADAAPTVAGSHMTQPRQSTPGSTFYPRARAADERPGDVMLPYP